MPGTLKLPSPKGSFFKMLPDGKWLVRHPDTMYEPHRSFTSAFESWMTYHRLEKKYGT